MLVSFRELHSAGISPDAVTFGKGVPQFSINSKPLQSAPVYTSNVVLRPKISTGDLQPGPNHTNLDLPLLSAPSYSYHCYLV
ncbi:hypothetical protein MHYP_G00356100 [Metynnis hypsauchen]